MPESIFDYLKRYEQGFEVDAEAEKSEDFRPTQDMPGTDAKIETMARRAFLGLPLWHPQDRRSYNDSDDGQS